MAITLKLGKLAPRHDPRTLKLSRYLDDQNLPAPAEKIDWSERIGSLPWGLMLNDQLGDCAIAGPGHMIMAWSAGKIAPSDEEILRAYEKVSGYSPRDPDSDAGCVLLDVLKYWRKHGIAGQKIFAFAEVNPRNQSHTKAAIDLFGGIDIGLALPVSAQRQIGGIWTVVGGLDGEVGSWGGHCVTILDYDVDGLTAITWGQKQRMTWPFFAVYCDEAYAVLSEDWCEKDAVAPSGFAFGQLRSDLSLL